MAPAISCRYPWDRREHFDYNAGHQLVQVTFSGHPTLTQAQYGYDIAGRRTHKTLTHHDGRQETTTFLWCGLRLYGESASHTPDTTLLYFYNEDSHEPLARATQQDGEYRLHWYHTQLNGLPEALTDHNGRVVWHGRYDEWGELKRAGGDEDGSPQSLRFAGQYFDRETGLHYTTFRYYDPKNGHFTQRDPIGLAGGLNLYAYAPNPLSYIDPLGLKCTHSAKNPKQAHAVIKDKWGHMMSKRDMRELQSTIDRIKLNKPRYSNDGTPFGNTHTIGNPNSQRLDTGTGPYAEWTVKTPDVGTNGQRRIVVDTRTGKAYYTHDHYESFIEIDLGGWK